MFLSTVGPILLSIPNYLNTAIVSVPSSPPPPSPSPPSNSSSGAAAAAAAAAVASKIYVVALSDLSKTHEIFYRFNMVLYLIILKIVPCAALTTLTGLLIHAMYKAEERSARSVQEMGNGNGMWGKKKVSTGLMDA